MSAGTRLGVCLALAALVIGATLAWLQWPASGGDEQAAAVSEGPVAREARINALRAQIERELERLQQAREQQDRTRTELRDLERSLERARERIEQLRDSANPAAADGS